MPKLDRFEIAGLAAAALLWLAACNAVPFGHYVDDIVWVLLSRSMIHGSLSADWSYFPRLETSLPLGFSLLLAPVVAVFGARAPALKAAAAAMAFAGQTLLYLALRPRLEPAARRAWLIALFFNGFALSFCGAVMSEAGYLLVFGACAYAALGRGWLRRSTPRQTLLLAAGGALLALTRSIGAAFLLAALAELWLSRRRREALRCAAAGAALLLPYAAFCKLASGSYAYSGANASLWQSAGPRIALANAWFYLKGLSLLTIVYFPAFLPNLAWLKAPAAFAATALALFGAARQARRPEGRWLAFYGLLFLAVSSLWPYQAPRYVLPVYALFAFWLVCGLSELRSARWRAGALAAFGMAVLASNAQEAAATLRLSWTQPAEIAHESHLWLRDHARPEDLVVSLDVARVRYFAGLRGVHTLAAESAEEFADRAARLGARWFFLKEAGYVGLALGAPENGRAQHDRLAGYLSRRDLFRLVYENRGEEVRIYAPALKPSLSSASAPTRSGKERR